MKKKNGKLFQMCTDVENVNQFCSENSVTIRACACEDVTVFLHDEHIHLNTNFKTCTTWFLEWQVRLFCKLGI